MKLAALASRVPGVAGVKYRPMTRRLRYAVLLAAGVMSSSGWSARAQQNSGAAGSWTFLASADARNCGDIVMPAIAETARKHNVAFYWHLGDLRSTFAVDEDIKNRKDFLAVPPTIDEYHAMQWQDFVEYQMAPFGADSVSGRHRQPRGRLPEDPRGIPDEVRAVARYAAAACPAADRQPGRPERQDVLPLDRPRRVVLLSRQRVERRVQRRTARLVRTRARARRGQPVRADDRRGDAQGVAGRLQLRPQHERIAEEHGDRPPGVRQPARRARQRPQARVRAREPPALLHGRRLQLAVPARARRRAAGMDRRHGRRPALQAAGAVASGRDDQRVWVTAGNGRARRRDHVRVPETRTNETCRTPLCAAGGRTSSAGASRATRRCRSS